MDRKRSWALAGAAWAASACSVAAEAPQDPRDAVAADTPAATVARQGDPVVEVPYRRVKGQMLIEVFIGGRGPFTFLVDTGVTGAAIDSDLAGALGIELDPATASEIPRPGSDEPALLYQTHIAEIAVGELEIDSLQAAALPLVPFGERLGEPLHGILGDGFLRTRVTRFDYVNRRMAFASDARPFAAEIASADYVLPMETEPDGSMPLLEVVLNGTPFVATLDTGSSLGLELFAPYASEFGLDDALETWERTTVLGGSIGQATSYDGVVERIDIGPLVLTDVPTSLTPARTGRPHKGNLGNQLWLDYVLILDFVDRRVIFRKPG